MKKLVLILLLLAPLLYGCSQGGSETPISTTTSSTTTTTATTIVSQRTTAFLGISLGASMSDVAVVLGNPTSTVSNMYFYNGFDYYVNFDANNKADKIATKKTTYGLKGLYVGDAKTSFQSILGTPDYTSTATNIEVLYWNTYGIWANFYTSTGLCYQIGIYSGDK